MSQKFLSSVTLAGLASGSILKVNSDGLIVEAVAGTDYVSSVSSGNLNALTDVVISNPSADQILVYGQPLGGDPGVNIWYNKTPNYLTSYTETDPIYTASSWYTTTNNASNWNTAYGWGNHSGLYANLIHTHSVFTQAASGIANGEEVIVAGENGFVPASGFDDGGKFLRGDGTWQIVTTDLTGYATETWVGQRGYLTSYTETDPVFKGSAAYGISAENISGWNTMIEWGNHADAGYLKSYTETDPIYTASSWYTTTNNSTNWNAAFGWGNHAGLYIGRVLNHTQGSHSYAYPDPEAWYKIAKVVLNGNCQSMNLFGEYRDLSYWQNTEYKIHITARAECDFLSNNESHNIRVNIVTSASNKTGFGDKVRVVLTRQQDGVREYELQYYRTTWDGGRWELQEGGGWTLYDTSQTAGTEIPSEHIVYNSNVVASNFYGDNVYINGYAAATQSWVGSQGYLTSYTETDPIYTASSWYTTTNNASNWDTVYGWGNHALAGYLTAETDSQTLEWNQGEKTLSISNGNSVDLRQMASIQDVEDYGFITAESDTLATVTGRGASTSSTLTSTSQLGLYVNSGSASYIGMNSTSNWAYVGLLNNGSTTWDIGTYNGGALEFRPYGGGNNAMYLGLDGALTINSLNDGKLNLRVPSGDSSEWNYINFVGSNGARDAYLGTNGDGTPTWWRDDNGVNITLGSSVLINGNTAWHAGNDGAGSGLDADLLDGVQLDNIVWGNARGTNDSITSDADGLDKTGYYTSSGFTTRPSGVSNWMYIEHIKLYNSNPLYQKQIGYDTYDNRMWVRTRNGGAGWTGWKQIWTSGEFANNSSNWDTAYGWGNHAGLYIPINPDGDGPAWSYSDENPTINGVGIGGTQQFGADGNSLTGGALQARMLNAYDGSVNSTYGYHVGSLNFGNDSGTHTTTQVINSAGTFVGPQVSTGKIYGSKLLMGSGTNENAVGNGGIRIGRTDTNYTHGSSWSGTSSTMFIDCSDVATITIHDSGNRLVEYMTYDGAGTNTIFTGRNIGWGTTNWSFGGDVSITGSLSASGYNKSNWDTAHGWGNHATANYWVTSNPDPQIVAASSVTFQYDVEIQGQLLETSSIRVKENIVDLEPVGDKVSKLRPVRYNKIGTDAQEIGLIAEEVAELFPEVVHYNEDGEAESLNYTRLSVLLLQTVKELSDRIQKLENK